MISKGFRKNKKRWLSYGGYLPELLTPRSLKISGRNKTNCRKSKSLLPPNRKGWLKVVESFIAIMLLASILFLVVGNTKATIKQDDFINEKQMEFLHGIQANDTLRSEVVNFPNFNLDSNSPGFPAGLYDYLQAESIHGLECIMRVCDDDTSCSLDLDSSEEIYTNKITIVSNLNTFDPNVVKLFCYE